MMQKERIAEIIAREAAQFIAREANSDPLITVVRAEGSSGGDRVRVFVSVLPEERTQAALSFLERHRETFSDYLKKNVRMRLPRVTFLLDNTSRDTEGGPGGN